jgi:hypothetical protein
MYSEDEFNQFVLDEVINSSSSDDELYDCAVQITLRRLIEEVNHSGRIGSIEGHDVVHCQRPLYHDLLYKDYSSNNPTFNAKNFRRRFASVLQIFI